MKGQRKAILDHLESKGSITSIEAFSRYGVTKLSAIVFDLRQMGYDIQTIPVETTNRFNEKVTFAKYKLLKEEN